MNEVKNDPAAFEANDTVPAGVQATSTLAVGLPLYDE